MIQFKALTKKFGENIAVDNLSLDINKGEVFGLLGPNGAGKTTIVNMAVGLLNPDQGTVELSSFGYPSQSSVRQMIGVAPQSLSLYDELTAEENLLFFGRIQGVSKKKLAERTSWALKFVDLEKRKNHRIKTYSGGMKRRLNLAVALLHEPALLILDEPTVGVDPQSRNAIFDNIRELKQKGCTIIYTTHYMEEAERLCDRVGIMDNGRLLAVDSVKNLIANHGGKSFLILERDGQEIRVQSDDPMKDLLAEQEKGDLTRFGMENPDLECVFLNLTGRRLRD